MAVYDDIGDKAYSAGCLAILTVEQRRVFEDTITAVGIPPTMRANARINLLRKYEEGGIDQVKAVLDQALRNRAAMAA
jgi:hypothetical protein|nr:hypothetical protein [Neorhizobium tomejilense]